MTRKVLIAGNWKLNKNSQETREFLGALEKFLLSHSQIKSEVVVFPTFTSLAAAQTQIQKSKLGAQNLSEHISGAFTGEVSAEMLKELSVTYVLVGHSERREIFKEDDKTLNAKVLRALNAGLKVIFCCGESLQTREAGLTDTWIQNQIKEGLQNVAKDNISDNIVIAYEPIWAIGTGKTCEASEANRVIRLIREQITILFGETNAQQMRILYGGSVKASTITEQMQESDIDGALIGGASLSIDEFCSIINLADLSKTESIRLVTK